MYSINSAKEAVKDGIRGYLFKDEDGNYVMDEVNRLPFYLEGSPGIGKTQMVSQIAEELGIGFVSFSITHHSRNTVLGLPVISEAGRYKYTEYTMSEIIAKVMEAYDQGSREGILLLDEFNCMSDTLMPVMLAFLQTKNIGMHRLPEGWIVVLCGNPVQYNRSARTFDYSVLDRLRRIEIEFNACDFLSYADEHGFNPIVLNYLRLHKDRIYMCERGKEDKLATARAWENLSIAVNVYEKTGGTVDEPMIGQFIKANETAREFGRYYELERKKNLRGEDMEKILEGIDIDGYCKRIGEMSLDIKFDVVDNLLQLIKDRSRKKEYKPRMISDHINNMLALLIRLNDNPLTEKAFSGINSDRKLLGILAKYKSEMFLKVCSLVYYGINPESTQEIAQTV
ncbi:MAG: AAA family ATPase [Lachnospiraceae bacterium]|nr:AAA family ATPase [Lachnospiraceae bacterium]